MGEPEPETESEPEPEPEESETSYDILKNGILDRIHSIVRKEVGKFHPDKKGVESTSDFQRMDKIGEEIEQILKECLKKNEEDKIRYLIELSYEEILREGKYNKLKKEVAIEILEQSNWIIDDALEKIRVSVVGWRVERRRAREAEEARLAAEEARLAAEWEEATDEARLKETLTKLLKEESEKSSCRGWKCFSKGSAKMKNNTKRKSKNKRKKSSKTRRRKNKRKSKRRS